MLSKNPEPNKEPSLIVDLAIIFAALGAILFLGFILLGLHKPESMPPTAAPYPFEKNELDLSGKIPPAQFPPPGG